LFAEYNSAGILRFQAPPNEETTIMPRSKTHLLTPFIALTALTPCLWPQTSVPKVYSYIQDPATGIMGSSVVKVARDGPKEAIDQILPVGPGRVKEFHNHILYDLQAHKIYTKLVSDPSVPCSVMTYTSPAVPDEFDVITASADSMKDFLAHAKLLRRETVNGIPAKVMELTADQMKVTASTRSCPSAPAAPSKFHNQHRRFRTQAHSQSHRHHPPARCQLHRSLPGQHPAHGKHHR
jgi:hypothetical protein